MNIKLRNWQQEAHLKALDWLVQKKLGRHLLINAAPGAGKTIASCAIAKTLIDLGEIDRIIVIAPRSSVVAQWADDFKFVTGRHVCKVTAADGDVSGLSMDVCATWSAVQGLLPELQAICNNNKTLVICDEQHHAAVQAAWGSGAHGAFLSAKYVLVLTGTPIRSDGAQIIWLAYDSKGVIDHPADGTYVLTYGQTVDHGYCRPAAIHRHEGKFTVGVEGEQIFISGSEKAVVPTNLKRVHGLQRALDFYRLARTPQYETDEVTPLRSGYQATMLECGSHELTNLRYRMPNAGGLVIAPSIEMAGYMAQLIENIEGEKPMIVHSNMPNAEAKIQAFRNTDKRWLVSVAMVSEGVDIKRLRVLVYLPNAMTELAFRQALGRVVRSAGPHDDTRAYVIMPSFALFETYAKRVEEEMPPSKRLASQVSKTKKCAACGHECNLGDLECKECGTEFPKSPERLKACADCGSLNPISSNECHSCGKSFTQNFSITLREALRDGAIVRGVEIEELQVQDGENMAEVVRARILSSGDDRLIKIIQTLPHESWGRLKQMMDISSS